MSEKTLSPVRPDSRNVGTLSRRRFMKVAFAGVASVALASCETAASRRMPAPVSVGIPATPVPHELSYPAVPHAPAVPPDPDVLYFFTEHQAATVDAFASRLLPGSPEDPGAHDAGVVNYIDYMLADNEGIHEPAYRLGPYPRLYQGDEPPPEAAETDSKKMVWVAADEIERYGYQSPLSPVEVYQIGLEALDDYSQEQYGSDFVDLGEDQQDAIITAMVEGEDLGFEPFSAQQFFHVLRRHTNEGFFADPAYGGNRDMVGWRLVGWPGSQRTYAPTEIAQEGIQREPWSLADLPPFYYARPRTTLPAAPARGPHPGVEEDEQDQRVPGHRH